MTNSTSEKRQLAAVMFTDIQGYTAMVQSDEASALETVRQHRTILEEKTSKYAGKVIEFYGDGSLSIYPSAIDAVRCAIEMQQAYRTGEVTPVRIGVHVGDIVIHEDSVFGNGVNVASRIESIGVDGNILISDRVNDELKNQADIRTIRIGNYNFKNVDRPIEVFAIDDMGIVVPQKRQIKGVKGSRITKTWIPITIVLLGLIFYFLRQFDVINLPDKLKVVVTEERIAVPPFKNYTGNEDLDFIGDMTAHLITQGLHQTEKANVVAFNTQEEMSQIVVAASMNLPEKFAKRSGALNIIDGAYNRHVEDSLVFNAFIKRISDGKVLYTFPPIYFRNDDPRAGIVSLASQVKGYWEAKDDAIMVMPNFEAYRYFMEARSLWNIDNTKTKEKLLSSIKSDSLFVDPYLYLISNYLNDSNYKEASRTLGVLRNRIISPEDRVANYMNYYDALISGDNRRAYELSQMDIQSYENDYFATTEYAILAAELVNNRKMAVKIFELDEMLDLDLRDCPYCVQRYAMAILSYLELGRFKKAAKLIAKLEYDLPSVKYYGILVYYYVLRNDRTGIDETIKRAQNSVFDIDENLLYYVATRESALAGYKENMEHYANLILHDAPKDHWVTSWAHYFLNDLNKALDGFEKDLSVSSRHLRALSQIGVIQAKLERNGEARKTIELLGREKSDYDFGAVSYNQARIWTQLGENDLAFELLQLAVDKGARFTFFNTFEGDIDLQKLKDDERFQRIIHPLWE